MPKITEYTAVTTPTDTDTLVVVQGNVTKRVTLATLKTSGGFAAYVKNNLDGTTAPSVTDDTSKGYCAGSVWIDTATSPMESYRCADATAGAAVWLKTTLTIDELGSGALREIEAATAENDMLVGGASPFSWVKKTLAQMKTILGLGGSVPAPVAESDFICAAGSPLDWAKKTLAEVRAILGLDGATTKILVGGGTGAAPVWTEATGSGAPVRATSPTLVTPVLGTPASGDLQNCTQGDTTKKGVWEGATNAETATGESTTLVVTPDDVKYRLDATCQNVVEDLSYLPPVTFTWDPGSLADGVGETSSAITVPGATLGSTAVQCIAPYDLQGITLNAYCDAANSCKARLQNETTGTIDLASGTWTMQARRI